jgi:hypothetical protein
VHDEWIPVRAALGLEDALCGGGVERAGGEAVDGFGWDGDEFAVAQEAGGLLNASGDAGVEPERRSVCRIFANR